jgi:hypothetical protein
MLTSSLRDKRARTANHAHAHGSGWSGVAPRARYLLIVRTVSFRLSRFVPTRRLSAIRVPG